MSRSRNEGTTSSSPVQRYLEYNGQTGNIRYYDKDKGENVEFEKAEIILLDVRNSVTGWHNTKETQITSNLVKNSKKEPFKVITLKNKNNPKITDVAEGLWNEDFKLKVNAVGANFTANLFALMKTKEGWQMVRLELKKAALGAWAGFPDELKKDGFETVYDGIIQISRSVQKKKGGIKYYDPVFKMVAAPEEVVAEAEAADEKLQAYFDEVVGATPEYSSGDTGTAAQGDAEAEAPVEDSAPGLPPTDEHDDLPF